MKFIQAIVAVATTPLAAAAIVRRALLVFCALAAFASASAHAAVWIQGGGNGAFVVRWSDSTAFDAWVSFTAPGTAFPVEADRLGNIVPVENRANGSSGSWTGNLSNGSFVVARVRFCNQAGKQSCTGYTQTAPAVVGSPGVPRNLRVTASTATAATPATPATPAGFTATWEAPLETGAGTINDYALQWRLEGAPQGAWNAADNSSLASATARSAAADEWRTTYVASVNAQDSATQKALVQGSAYQLRIAAVSTIGIGQWSAESPVVPGTTPISAPRNLRAGGTIQQTLIELEWEVPARHGSSDPSVYLLRWSEGAGTSNWVMPPSATKVGSSNRCPLVACAGRRSTAAFVRGLKAGTTYVFQVRASNEAGDGAEWTPSVEIATADFTAPSAAPSGLRITPQPGNKLLLEWTQLTDRTNGGGLDGYRYRWSNDGNASTWESSGGEAGVAISNSVNAESATIDVTGGLTYMVQVAGYNSTGTGPWTESQTAFTGAPPAPTGLQISATTGMLALTWSAPSGNASITEYRYRWSNNGDDNTWESGGGEAGVAIPSSATATTATISGVTNGVIYHVQLAAVNSLGTGGWTSAVMGRPLGTPGQPGAISAAVGDMSLLVSWEAPSERGGASERELRYQVQWRAASVSGFAGGDSADIAGKTSHRISGLTNGIAYVVQVRAVNAADTSIWGETRSTPRGFTLDVDGSGGDADGTDGVLIARYLLGFRGMLLTADLTLPNGVTAANIETTLGDNLSSLDVDNSGGTTAADGIIIARYLFGVESGEHLTNGQTMTNEATVRERIMGLLP